MTPWWLVMVAGVLGSSHCVGMCGPFAAIVGMRTTSIRHNLQAQLVYSAGRLSSYGVIGAIAGYAGQRISESVPSIINVPAVLCLIAGLFLVFEGLKATGVFRLTVSGTSTTGCLLGPVFSTILKAPGARNTFVAGIVTGLLPCGLVYAFVSLAATTGDLLRGLGTMLAFGAGTIPLMVLSGFSASLLSATKRQLVWKIAAWSVVATGSLTIFRGVSFLERGRAERAATCPFCATEPATKTSPAPLATTRP